MLKLEKQKRFLTEEKKKQLENTYQYFFVFSNVVLGEDDHKMNWRDACCPLDVTTATNILTHTSALAPSEKKQQPKNTGMHPRRCHLIMFRCIFFAMATVIHADKASGISFKIATFESVVYFPPSSLLKDV